MTEEKAKRATGEKKAAGKARRKGDGPRKESSQTAAGEKIAGEELRGRADQIGDIFGKILELAEAGLGLGVNLVSRLGSLVQEQILERMTGEDRPGGAQGPFAGPGPGPQPPGQEQPEAMAGAPGSTQSYGVVNRLPLFPGSPVHISFSINNESQESAKRLHLEVQDFIGTTRDFKLDAGLFSVHPAEQVIAPMDFEKFFFTGAIPGEAPEDTYYSWITVRGEEEVKIPVILMVGKPMK